MVGELRELSVPAQCQEPVQGSQKGIRMASLGAITASEHLRMWEWRRRKGGE